ncbi:ferredoxin--NADP reductase [Fructobacillus pseudoficulneus]|uniref:Ferredoxin--NADP reductase n=1 Tax=Fructobacillus pseudoficulneus TaxID=220714 RepID=A0A3F3H9R3_9LACO|nr:NAD(P)/FAD-dependent oxidoreductase [Fructobacillus pseudoficulneus]GAP03209.1 ferredoxin--NADP reductase [Fructobacillus pseudoficulneus]SEH42694.1 thioredoxin reductase (NADPH) [Fructobacillus pseudoficulneus]
MEKTYDIIIVGGGPAGMFAAFYASLRNMRVLLLEALTDLGGQIQTLYPDKKIWDVAGVPGISGRGLVEQLQEQLSKFPVDVRTEAKVSDIAWQNDQWQLTVNEGEALYQGRSVILATGKGAFEPRRLQIENEKELEGRGLSYFAPDLSIYRGKKVAVLGGGDAAVDLATQLDGIAAETYLIHRRNQFRALEQAVLGLEKTDVIKKTPLKVAKAVLQEDQQLRLTLEHVKDKSQVEDLLVDQLLVQYGFLTKGQADMGWQVDLDWDAQGIVVEDHIKTKQDRLFAIGDVSSYPGHADLIATGFGQAPAAVNAAIAAIDPGQGGPGHSSSMNID